MSVTKENRNCPYCLSPVEAEEQKVRCPKCGVVHHADCWRANGSCSVYGCDGWAIWNSQITDRLAPDPQGRVELTDGQTTPTATNVKEEVLCIKCGEPVRQGQLVCVKCRMNTRETHFLENCFGPAVLIFGCVGTVITLVVRALI